MGKHQRGPFFVLLALGVLAAGSTGAVEPKLSEILPQFFVDGITLAPIAGHEAHFLDQGDALAVMGQLNGTLASQFATFPLGASSGAFTFNLDPETGAYVPSSDSFGPIFAERPETLGKNKINVGLTSLFYEFDSLEGLAFDKGEIVFTLVHQDTNADGTPLAFSFEGDVIDSRLFAKLSLNTNIVFASFGVTDNLDLGIAVPIVRAELDATIRSTILPISTGAGIHEFAGGALTQDESRGGTASGLGDVVLRGKYNFRKGFAGAFDLRLPTGDEENLLGSGATQLRLLLIARGPKYDVLYGGLYPHLNLGYTASNGGYTVSFDDPTIAQLKVEPSDEINYAVGFDAALGPRVTFALDIVGRLLLDAQEISLRDRSYVYTALTGNVSTLTRPELVTTTGDLSVVLGTAGVKINLGKSLLLTVSGLVPVLKDRGLEADFTASFGLDYTF